MSSETNPTSDEQLPDPPDPSPWPYRCLELAWAPGRNREVSAIPLVPKDLHQPMTWDTYLLRLMDRLDWLVELAGGNKAAVNYLFDRAHGVGGLSLEGLDENHRVGLQLVESPHLLDLLISECRLGSQAFPQKPVAEEDARESLQRLTLGDWVANLLPSEGLA